MTQPADVTSNTTTPHSAPAPLRLGIVGTGLIAGLTTAAFSASAGCQPVAVSSRQRQRAADFAVQHQLAGVFDDWRELLASSSIDAVYVATPTAARETIALAAARAGKHVLAEKPFASLASLQAIVGACRQHGRAFMDGTHFVHHPRTALLASSLHSRIGAVRALRASFFFPTSDHANLRHDPAQEPMGAIGDMGWYVMRAITEFAAPHQTLLHSSGTLERDPVSQAVVRGAGWMHFDGGCTATWDVGYNANACTQDLQLLGERGVVSLDDFVLDWAQAFMLPLPGHVAGFTQHSGVVNSGAHNWVPVPAPVPANVRMVEYFARLAADPQGPAAQASMAASLRTQALLDAAWASALPA